MIHLSPSNLNSWNELRTANEDSPPWVTAKNFKDQILGVKTVSMKAVAGNALSNFLFGGDSTYEERGFSFVVDKAILSARSLFPFGTGVPEVSKLLELDRSLTGDEPVRISMRADYLTPSRIVELKSSSRSFRSKGKTRAFLESPQALSYLYTWGLPITFIFGEISIKEKENSPNIITVKDVSSATAFPHEDNDRRLLECVNSLIPYLKADEEMWNRVTSRNTPDEF